jgi:hypothetical protein
MLGHRGLKCICLDDVSITLRWHSLHFVIQRSRCISAGCGASSAGRLTVSTILSRRYLQSAANDRVFCINSHRVNADQFSRLRRLLEAHLIYWALCHRDACQVQLPLGDSKHVSRRALVEAIAIGRGPISSPHGGWSVCRRQPVIAAPSWWARRWSNYRHKARRLIGSCFHSSSTTI